MTNIVSELDEMLEFLDGDGPLEGTCFGETHPTEHGKYWWRSRLRKLGRKLRAALSDVTDHTDQQAREHVHELQAREALMILLASVRVEGHHLDRAEDARKTLSALITQASNDKRIVLAVQGLDVFDHHTPGVACIPSDQWATLMSLVRHAPSPHMEKTTRPDNMPRPLGAEPVSIEVAVNNHSEVDLMGALEHVVAHFMVLPFADAPCSDMAASVVRAVNWLHAKYGAPPPAPADAGGGG